MEESKILHVRLEGGEVVHRAIKSLSAENGISIAHAVTQGLHLYWGERLSQKVDALIAEGGLKNVHSDAEKTSNE